MLNWWIVLCSFTQISAWAIVLPTGVVRILGRLFQGRSNFDSLFQKSKTYDLKQPANQTFSVEILKISVIRSKTLVERALSKCSLKTSLNPSLITFRLYIWNLKNAKLVNCASNYSHDTSIAKALLLSVSKASFHLLQKRYKRYCNLMYPKLFIEPLHLPIYPIRSKIFKASILLEIRKVFNSDITEIYKRVHGQTLVWIFDSMDN